MKSKFNQLQKEFNNGEDMVKDKFNQLQKEFDAGKDEIKEKFNQFQQELTNKVKAKVQQL